MAAMAFILPMTASPSSEPKAWAPRTRRVFRVDRELKIRRSWGRIEVRPVGLNNQYRLCLESCFFRAAWGVMPAEATARSKIFIAKLPTVPLNVAYSPGRLFLIIRPCLFAREPWGKVDRLSGDQVRNFGRSHPLRRCPGRKLKHLIYDAIPRERDTRSPALRAISELGRTPAAVITSSCPG